MTTDILAPAVRRNSNLCADDLVGNSEVMRKVVALATRASKSDANVLVTGESGVGKTAVARWIHANGARHAGPLVQVNCAAMPSPLVEAELFGKKELFSQAQTGTLYVDEIGEMSLDLQSKLLLALETASPLVRVIAATTRPIELAVKTGRFRQELFYRLAVIRLDMPALRERREDIPELVRAFLGDRQIEDSALQWLVEQDWPGNVRQLANVIERALALGEHDTVTFEDVAITDGNPVDDVVERLLRVAAERHVPLAEIEHAYIKRVVASVAGNMSRAARILKIDRRTLYRKLSGHL